MSRPEMDAASFRAVYVLYDGNVGGIDGLSRNGAQPLYESNNVVRRNTCSRVYMIDVRCCMPRGTFVRPRTRELAGFPQDSELQAMSA